MSVVVRFAPSPTGFLHIGGARTALFNWLFARHHAGKFLLRIEDTDRERSTPEAVSAIVDGLDWLGLAWDGEIVHQFERAPRHAEIAQQLLSAGHAYYCYCTPAELEARSPYHNAVYIRTEQDLPDHVASALQEQGQNLKRLLLQTKLGAVLAQFAGGEVELEYSKTRDSAGVALEGGHGQWATDDA